MNPKRPGDSNRSSEPKRAKTANTALNLTVTSSTPSSGGNRSRENAHPDFELYRSLTAAQKTACKNYCAALNILRFSEQIGRYESFNTNRECRSALAEQRKSLQDLRKVMLIDCLDVLIPIHYAVPIAVELQCAKYINDFNFLPILRERIITLFKEDVSWLRNYRAEMQGRMSMLVPSTPEGLLPHSIRRPIPTHRVQDPVEMVRSGQHASQQERPMLNMAPGPFVGVNFAHPLIQIPPNPFLGGPIMEIPHPQNHPNLCGLYCPFHYLGRP